MHSFSFTPNIIDIEASGFGPLSYPIEVGVVLANGKRYCSLIQPAEEWTFWDPDAERIHQLSRDLLERHGKPLSEVAETLNSLLDGKTLYSDGWVVDKPWINLLFHRARKAPRFWLSDLQMILSEAQMTLWHETKRQLITELELIRHRASTDAYLIQRTYAETLRRTTSDGSAELLLLP